MHALVSKYDERLLLRAVQILRNERIGADDERVPRTGSAGVRISRRRQAGVFDLIDLRDIAQQQAPHYIVDMLEQFVRRIRRRWLLCRRGRLRRRLCRGGLLSIQRRGKEEEREKRVIG